VESGLVDVVDAAATAALQLERARLWASVYRLAQTQSESVIQLEAMLRLQTLDYSSARDDTLADFYVQHGMFREAAVCVVVIGTSAVLIAATGPVLAALSTPGTQRRCGGGCTGDATPRAGIRFGTPTAIARQVCCLRLALVGVPDVECDISMTAFVTAMLPSPDYVRPKYSGRRFDNGVVDNIS
jgi:hypothetical protein